MRTKAFSYIRMSTERQLLGDSLKRQFELAQAYAAEHDLDLDNMKPDIGLSGWTGANRLEGTLSKFLGKVGTPAVPRGSVLLVESLDRISRENVLEAQALFLTIINAGITIVTLSKTGQRVYEREAMKENPIDLIVSMLEMVRANAESELKSTRLKGAWKTKREKIADGVKMTAACPAWFTKVGNDYIEIPQKADLVRRIFNELANGLGKDKIAQRLNDEGVPALRETNKARGWHASTIHHLVHAKNVLGLYQPCLIVHEDGKKRRVPHGEPRENYYPAIITEDLYQRVIAAMAARTNEGAKKNGGRKGVRHSNLFGNGLATCTTCGGSMLFKRGDKRSPSYLRCGNAVRRAGCDNTTHFQYEPFEKNLLATLVDLHVIDNGAPRTDELANELAAKNRLLAANQTAIDNQMKLGDELGPDPALIARITALRQEERSLRASLADLNAKLSAEAGAPSPSEHVAAVADLMKDIAGASDAEAFLLRTRVAGALAGLLDFMHFDPSGIITVSVFRGLKAYRFDRKGVLIRSANVVDAVKPFSAVVYQDGKPVTVHSDHERIRLKWTDGDPELERQLDRMIANAKL